MLRNFLLYVFFKCKLHNQWQLFFKSRFIISALKQIIQLSHVYGFIEKKKKKNGADVTRGRGNSGAEVTKAEVSGAEVVGAEVSRG